MSAAVSCTVSASLAAAQVQATAFSEGTMTATVKITRRTTVGALDYATGLVSDPDTTVYEGKARLGQVVGGDPMILGDEQEFFSRVNVAIPLNAPLVIIDDMVEILTNPDPHVVGRLFRVTDTEGGGAIPADQSFNALGVARSRSNT